MTPESVTIRQPEHPVPALTPTSWQLRRELAKTSRYAGADRAASSPGGCSPRSSPNGPIARTFTAGR